ncbi:hypothetical protein E0I74_31275 [Rhizobium laguerreae]|uniref:hypothetical protein n=1 Tax=Rhizobium laguerreae TaxID=1076926 RepID=UPI00103F7F30|nr:hypothetical protein [Rhizobium laguerreae]MBY3259363.1 hypothetical protein [Rhizobium laguerreae]MBY3268270.1 hypothetical protein [Rhizobium laguerreae]MBY3286786.1 hypothetical protein [Rhizobium laguerreae]MBY3293805.1 hypothetical protein [Rhizobium laguerreae]MBY3299364.1 hypothetical protein [Rhizobium laguerreae]
MEQEAASFDDHAFAPMVSLELNVAMFKSRWQFCDKITEYLSDILGQGHSDPARYSNFLSVATNELIELAFRSTSELGRISFSLYRNATFNRLRITFPCEEVSSREHTNARASEHQPVSGAGSGYVVMKSDGTVLLSDLAAIFRATIRIEKDGRQGIQIIADFSSTEDFQ